MQNITADLAPSSAKRYTARLETFRQFMRGRQLSKSVLGEFKISLAKQGLSPSTVNGYLASIRKLIGELVEAGMLDPGTAHYIQSIKGAKSLGVRTGNWLSKSQAQALLRAPDRNTLKGKRDLAILALSIYCGLRRSELVSLTVGHLQMREGHWVILDLRGKHGRLRTIWVHPVVKRIIDTWLEGRTMHPDAPLFVSFAKGDKPNSHAPSSQAIYDLIRKYGETIGVEIAAHDLRRTFAQLSHRGGAPLEAISQAMGHASLETTQAYLGLQLDLDNAAGSYIRLKL